jgi:hypothetical protein
MSESIDIRILWLLISTALAETSELKRDRGAMLFWRVMIVISFVALVLNVAVEVFK